MDQRRREERIPISLPIRVWGMDASHRPFTQTATTLDLTRAGVRVGGLDCQLQSGEIIGVQHGSEKGRFRVVWAGKKGGAQHGQAGLVCVEPGKYIWGVPLQQLAPGAKPALGPRDAQSAPPLQSQPRPEPEKPGERRGDTRYATTGGAEVCSVKEGSRAWGILTDVGTSGCYIEMATPPKAGASVRLVLSLQGTDIHCTGEVKNSHAGVGMGVSFLEMSPEDRHRLDEIVKRIAAGVTVPMTPTPSKQAEPTPPPAPHPKATALAGYVRQITSALRAMEDLIASAGLDFEGRVLREFRRTLDHTRENTWALQQWLEEGADQNKVYKLLDEMETKRMRSAIQLLRELAMDVEANALHLGTEGMDDLSVALEHLQKRLMALKQGDGRVVDEVEDQLPR